MKFARVFNFPVPGKDTEVQVLMTKTDYDSEKDSYELELKTMFDNTENLDLTLSATLGFETEEERDEAFDEYTEEEAKNIRLGLEGELVNLLSQNGDFDKSVLLDLIKE